MNSKIKFFALFCLVFGACMLAGCGTESQPIAKLTGLQGQVDIKPAAAEVFATASAEQKLSPAIRSKLLTRLRPRFI